jgi:hypothetical protein
MIRLNMLKATAFPPETILHLGLTYTHGYSMNYIQKLPQEMILLNNEQHQVFINWYHAPNSSDVKAGEYLSKKVNYFFNFIDVKEIY